MFTVRRVLLASFVALTFMGVAITATRNTARLIMPLAPLTAASPPFTSIELHDGAKAVLQYGAIQSVALVKGNQQVSRVTVEGDRLVIEKCRDNCPRGYQLEVEVVTPAIAAISISDGGTIESRGDFPRQTEISFAVSNGGMIDARAILAGNVAATVNQGGSILAKPQATMVASVSNGGVITYWGDAQVTSSTQRGGQVIKGAKEEANKPVSEFVSGVSCDSHVAAPNALSGKKIKNRGRWF